MIRVRSEAIRVGVCLSYIAALGNSLRSLPTLVAHSHLPSESIDSNLRERGTLSASVSLL